MGYFIGFLSYSEHFVNLSEKKTGNLSDVDGEFVRYASRFHCCCRAKKRLKRKKKKRKKEGKNKKALIGARIDAANAAAQKAKTLAA